MDDSNAFPKGRRLKDAELLWDEEMAIYIISGFEKELDNMTISINMFG